MFDHVGFIIQDFSRSLVFYERGLAPRTGVAQYDAAFVHDPDGNHVEASLRE